MPGCKHLFTYHALQVQPVYMTKGTPLGDPIVTPALVKKRSGYKLPGFRSLPEVAISEGALWSIPARRDRIKCKRISGLGLRPMNRSWRKFEDRMRTKTPRQPPRGYRTHKFPDPLLAVKIDEVDRKAHPEGVHGFAWNDPQSLSGGEAIASKQPLVALRAAVCHFHTGGNDGVACQIANSNERILRGSTPGRERSPQLRDRGEKRIHPAAPYPVANELPEL